MTEKSEPVGASLSAQTPPDGGSDKVKSCLRFIRQCVSGRCNELDLEVIRGEIDGALGEADGNSESLRRALKSLYNEVHGALGIAEPEIRAAIGNTNMACIERRLSEAKSALGGAAQEGDCPCGATVVRKSDSANKSKLCADCAAQEEAPSPTDGALPKLPNLMAEMRRIARAHHDGGGCLEEHCGCPGSRLAALIRELQAEFGGVVAEEEVGNPTERKIRLLHDVRGDFPMGHVVARAGIYHPHINPQGAVSVIASDGKLLGIKPNEFELAGAPEPQEPRCKYCYLLGVPCCGKGECGCKCHKSEPQEPK